MSDLKKRMMEFLQKLEISQAKFEKKAGLTNGTVNNTGESYRKSTLDKIKTAYPELNVNWLLTGEGEMLKPPKNKTAFDENKTENKPLVRTLPLIPIDAVAGVPSGDFQGVRFIDCEQYAIPEFVERGAEFVVRVSGSSMYPKYSNGDILACKKIADILFIQWGKVYVIDSSQGSLVKRLFEDKDNPDKLICVSDNKANYPPFSIPKQDIRSLSLVIGVVRLE